MDNLALDEKRKYEVVWEGQYDDGNTYRIKNHSISLVKQFPEILYDVKSIIDLGCGAGAFFAEMNEKGFDACGIDIASNALNDDVKEKWGEDFMEGCLWDLNNTDIPFIKKRFDLGMCCDVMEHIPPIKIETVFRQIYNICDVTHFAIANFTSNFREEKLHLTIESQEWWMEKIKQVVPEAKINSFNRPLVDHTHGGVRQGTFHISMSH